MDKRSGTALVVRDRRGQSATVELNDLPKWTGELARRVAILFGYETGLGHSWTLGESKSRRVRHYQDAPPSEGEWELVEGGSRV